MSNDTRICYRPDGSSLPDQVPCSSSEYTHCCKTGSICLANGFCAPTREPYVFYRGGCTNQRWDQGCPEYCNQPDDPYWLQWEDDANGQHTYCCTWFQGTDGNRAYGCNGSRTFTLSDSGVMYGSALLENITSFNDVANETVTATETAPAPTGSSSREIAIGAGLGVPLGALMLAFLAWALFERRARFRERDERSVPVAMSNGTGVYPPVESAYPNGTVMDKPPVELDRNPGVSELMGRER